MEKKCSTIAPLLSRCKRIRATSDMHWATFCISWMIAQKSFGVKHGPECWKHNQVGNWEFNFLQTMSEHMGVSDLASGFNLTSRSDLCEPQILSVSKCDHKRQAAVQFLDLKSVALFDGFCLETHTPTFIRQWFWVIPPTDLVIRSTD